MNNLILGHKGFLGARLSSYLKSQKQNVIGIDIKEGLDLRKIKLDIKNIDRIYFLAWDVGGSKYLYNKNNQLFQLEWNLHLMQNVFPQIQNKSFVFISSQLAENIETVYGSQKKLGEIWTKLCEKGICIRLWNIYGYSQTPDERSYVVSDFIYQAIVNKKIVMLTKGDESRQFVHIDDVCDGLVKAFSIKDKNQTYDISSGEWVKIIDLAKMISEESGCAITPNNKCGKSLWINNKKFVPNWMPVISLRDGIKKMIKEFKMENNE